MQLEWIEVTLPEDVKRSLVDLLTDVHCDGNPNCVIAS